MQHNPAAWTRQEKEAFPGRVRRIQDGATRIRFPIVLHTAEAYTQPQIVLDVACGVHPLSIPWMGLPADVVYIAYEISAKMVASLNGFLAAIGMTGSARLQDVICTPPQETGDLAFLMKMVPCLERRQKGIAVKLIENLKVDYVVVSFPVHSLAGRSKHMPEFYTQTFIDMVDEYPWQVTHVPIEGELVFVVDKRTG